MLLIAHFLKRFRWPLTYLLYLFSLFMLRGQYNDLWFKELLLVLESALVMTVVRNLFIGRVSNLIMLNHFAYSHPRNGLVRYNDELCMPIFVQNLKQLYCLSNCVIDPDLNWYSHTKVYVLDTRTLYKNTTGKNSSMNDWELINSWGSNSENG